MTIFIDSSVWIEWLRSRIDPRPLIAPWLERRLCFSCSIVRVEVTRGLIGKQQRENVNNLFDVFEDVPFNTALMNDVNQNAWELDRKGIVLPISDLIISACVKYCDAWLVTLDNDFSRVPGIKIRSSLPKLEY